LPNRQLAAHSETHHEIVVVGAGFSGIGAAVRLKKDGFSDFVLLERAAEPGGAWRDNTYPGVAVDVSSLCYSFSFAPNPAWSRVFAPGSEIREYAGQCADRYGLRAHMRFTTRVVEARFDDAACVWRLRTTRGPLSARHLVTACGTLSEPRRPDLEGLDAFAGPQLHTARWDPRVPLRGRRVAVIGTGASGVQVVPPLAALAGRLYVFQRTARWVLPRPDGAMPRWLTALFRRAPLSQAALRLLAGALTELAMATGAGRRRPARALRGGLEWVGAAWAKPGAAARPRSRCGARRTRRSRARCGGAVAAIGRRAGVRRRRRSRSCAPRRAWRSPGAAITSPSTTTASSEGVPRQGALSGAGSGSPSPGRLSSRAW
jgi:cation diffusion facilitator CzcD-associated flavoprotein CzcO